MTEPTTWNEAIAHAALRCIGSPGLDWRTTDDIASLVRDASRPVPWARLGRSALGALYAGGRLEPIMKEIVDLCVRKQTDYGHDNINAYGQLGLRVRASDKLARIKNMDGKPGVAEPARDAWVDLVGYSLIGLMLEAGTFDLELAEPEPASAPPWVQLDIYEELP